MSCIAAIRSIMSSLLCEESFLLYTSFSLRWKALKSDYFEVDSSTTIKQILEFN